MTTGPLHDPSHQPLCAEDEWIGQHNFSGGFAKGGSCSRSCATIDMSCSTTPSRPELESMYRGTGAGRDPTPPALLAMAILLQAYGGVSDFEAVELTVMDLRWQMVLDRLGKDEAAFAQGTLREFRERLIRTDMDRRLVERTIELARRTKAFDWRKLPKDLRVAIDSMPLERAGRVEDTINLLGHAARNVVRCAADLLGWSVEKSRQRQGFPCSWS